MQRRKASLLKANGHPDAGLYTIGRIYEEAELIVERANAHMATEAVLLQNAIASVLSAESAKEFASLLKGLTGD